MKILYGLWFAVWRAGIVQRLIASTRFKCAASDELVLFELREVSVGSFCSIVQYTVKCHHSGFVGCGWCDVDVLSSADRPGLAYEQTLRGDVSSHVIDSLEEDKKYTVSIYAVYPEGKSEPVSVVGRTCMWSYHSQSYFCVSLWVCFSFSYSRLHSNSPVSLSHYGFLFWFCTSQATF